MTIQEEVKELQKRLNTKDFKEYNLHYLNSGFREDVILQIENVEINIWNINTESDWHQSIESLLFNKVKIAIDKLLKLKQITYKI